MRSTIKDLSPGKVVIPYPVRLETGHRPHEDPGQVGEVAVGEGVPVPLAGPPDLVLVDPGQLGLLRPLRLAEVGFLPGGEADGAEDVVDPLQLRLVRQPAVAVHPFEEVAVVPVLPRPEPRRRLPHPRHAHLPAVEQVEGHLAHRAEQGIAVAHHRDVLQLPELVRL